MHIHLKILQLNNKEQAYSYLLTFTPEGEALNIVKRK